MSSLPPVKVHNILPAILFKLFIILLPTKRYSFPPVSVDFLKTSYVFTFYHMSPPSMLLNEFCSVSEVILTSLAEKKA